ncbi:hypothetical protein C0J52_26365 [Blattella germanica]|nr:hypothetical protein C0J52_26365 [Blattella germanica]
MNPALYSEKNNLKGLGLNNFKQIPKLADSFFTKHMKFLRYPYDFFVRKLECRKQFCHDEESSSFAIRGWEHSLATCHTREEGIRSYGAFHFHRRTCRTQLLQIVPIMKPGAS